MNKKFAYLLLSCILSFSLAADTLAPVDVKAESYISAPEEPESVTYYLQGGYSAAAEKVDPISSDGPMITNDTMSPSQWALYNDGSFTLDDYNSKLPVYDDPLGSPIDIDDYFDEFFGDDFFDSFFGNDPFTSIINDFFGGHNSYYDNFFGGHNSYYDNFFGGRNQKKDPYRRMNWIPYSGSSNGSFLEKAKPGIDINITEAWDTYKKADKTREVIVAVIDTGVDYNHEDLKDSIWVNPGEIPGNGIDDDNNGYIDDVYGWNFVNNSNQVFTGSHDDHGTHCAGTIVAEINNEKGVASVAGDANVKVMVIKALDGYAGTGTTDAVVKAIKYAEANGASIVNMSLGSGQNESNLYYAIGESNMLFVIAAGNGNTTSMFSSVGINNDEKPCYPASYELDNIISVANISYTGELHSSSNYGAKSVDLAAPGAYIISTTPKDTYGYMTGTSMAAPFVTAAAAMVYSYYPNITLPDVKEIILNTVTPLESLKGKVATSGLLNVGNALKYDLSKLSKTTWKKVERPVNASPNIKINPGRRNNGNDSNNGNNNNGNNGNNGYYYDIDDLLNDIFGDWFGFPSYGNIYTNPGNNGNNGNNNSNKPDTNNDDNSKKTRHDPFEDWFNGNWAKMSLY